jgi:hypothetical protein
MSKVTMSQIAFGNKVGDWETEEWVDALIDYIVEEIDRVYWNLNQEEWNRQDDPKLKGLKYNPYYWGEDRRAKEKSNLKFKHSPQEIRWYKHIGVGQTSSIKMSNEEWIDWFNGALKIIRDNDKKL